MNCCVADDDGVDGEVNVSVYIYVLRICVDCEAYVYGLKALGRLPSCLKEFHSSVSQFSGENISSVHDNRIGVQSMGE